MNKSKVYVDTFKFDKNVITVMIYDTIDTKYVKKNIEDICQKDYKKIDKNVTNDDLYSGYVAIKIEKFLKDNNINKYIINENGDITVGKRYNNKPYKISINDVNNKVLKIVNLENENISTIRDNNNSISIIGKDTIKNKEFKHKLNDLSIEEGKEMIKNMDIAVLWYKDGKITMSDTFEKYVK